jgi:putative YhbY family RNA-binding protein
MNDLTPAGRRALRARAHGLAPIVMIGSAGLTPAVLKEIDIALRSHELIKVRMLGDDRAARAGAFERICIALGANPVQLIGKVLVLFRPAPKEEEARPAAKPRPARRRAKRSFQTRRT